MSRAGDLWTVSVGNAKTGPIPTQTVGVSERDTAASCAGCALAPGSGKTGDGGCYAWRGMVRRGAWSLRKAHEAGKATDLATVLQRTPRGARFARFGGFGDPARLERTALWSSLRTVRAAGLGVIGYTHHWRAEPRTGALRTAFLASAETMADADEATRRGWLVALAGPAVAPAGFVLCRNAADASVTCNACGLCDVTRLRKTGFRGVVFPAHGASAKRLPMAGA